MPRQTPLNRTRNIGIMALAPQLDVQHHGVVALTGDSGFGVVAVEPLVDLYARPGRFNPALELIAHGQIVFDDGNFGHGSCEVKGWLDYGCGPHPAV